MPRIHVDYANIPEKYLKETAVEGPIQTRLYEVRLLHKEFAPPWSMNLTHLATRVWPRWYVGLR